MSRTSPTARAAMGLISLALVSCGPSRPALEVEMLVGSALAQFCGSAAGAIQADPPRLADGTPVTLRCRAAGSGDVVDEMETHARAVLAGGEPADSSRIPTLISVDGEIYHELLRWRLQRLSPSRALIPAVADAPALATSPMVLMTSPALAKGLGIAEPYQAMARSKTHRDLDPSAPGQPIRFVHTAPTRSNSGLQTLVAMVAEVAGKRPEQLSLEDVRAQAPKIAAIQRHITRYGSSTDELARAMGRNGPYWASVGSVYESSVVSVNNQMSPDQERLQAVYPRATYASTMRAILPEAPWVSDREREAALLLIERLKRPDVQKLAAEQGLRPANPAVPASRVTAANGVNPAAVYDSLRAPRPEVVEAMISTWRDLVKKPSRVALLVDSSGSMRGEKLPAAQTSLKAYLDHIGPRDTVALFDFDSSVRSPVVVKGGAANAGDSIRGQDFIAGLQAEGGTLLYDAVLAGQKWLLATRQPGEMLAVVVLTDGRDNRSTVTLTALNAILGRGTPEGDGRISVFSVGYGGKGDYDDAVLRALAETNGGEFATGTPETIRQRMEALQLAF